MWCYLWKGAPSRAAAKLTRYDGGGPRRDDPSKLVYQTETSQEPGNPLPSLFAEPGERCNSLYAVAASGTLAQAVTAVLIEPS